MKRIIAFFLAVLLLFTFIGCSNHSQTEDNSAEILSQRRDQVESYMRSMATVLWRATEDIIYSNSCLINYKIKRAA